MQHLILKCSLCCDQTFESKLALTEHLKNVLANLTCPVCNNKWSSLAHLIEHLNLDDCQPDILIDHAQTNNEDTTLNDIIADQYDDNANEAEDVNEEKLFTVTTNEISDESKNSFGSGNNLYLHFKEKANTCPPTQELKITNEGCIEPYVVMPSEDTDISLGNVVTKQNSDGTISLQTIKDLKLEPVNEQADDTVIAPSEIEPDDNQEELYSCNTCGVSFTSVLEHIHNYHNDQVVVVEESGNNDIPMEFEQILEEPLPVQTQEPIKRLSVITENGDIVDAVVENTLKVPEVSDTPMKNDEVEKSVRQPVKRFVQVDKLCDSIVKPINPDDMKGPYYHKVIVVKDVIVDGQGVKTYFCMSCHIYVSSLDEFKNQPCKMFKYPCPHCPVAYENSKSLCAHMKVHKVKAGGNLGSRGNPPQSAAPTQSCIASATVIKPATPDAVHVATTNIFYKCEICNTTFTTNKSLKLHKRMHDPIKSRPIEPPIETAQGTEGCTDRYRCGICDKMIPTDYREVHQNSHKTDDQMNCVICNKKFQSTEYLEMHMSVHNMDKVSTKKNDQSLPYCCLYCDRRFARPHEKVKHERIHTGEKPHSCEICGKSFRVAYCLTLHMRTHTGARPYSCPLCGKRFKAHSVYNHHLMTHSEVRRYKCPFCPKAFKTSVQLAGHKNSHTKPFSCTQCNRPFASLYAVRVHTETHSRQNNLKFACSLCGASYARAFALKDHFKQVHNQDVDPDTLDANNVTKAQENWVLKQVEENSVEGETITGDQTMPECQDSVTKAQKHWVLKQVEQNSAEGETVIGDQTLPECQITDIICTDEL